MDENIIKDLIRLIEIGMITTDDIKDLEYKAEVDSRLS